jgi:hypothetical protein
MNGPYSCNSPIQRYRPDRCKLWIIHEKEEDEYLWRLAREEKYLMLRPTASADLRAQLFYHLPSANASSQMLGGASPTLKMRDMELMDVDDEGHETSQEEESRSSWSSGSESPSNVTTPAAEQDDPFAIEGLVGIESAKTVAQTSPRQYIDYSGLPLPPVPSHPTQANHMYKLGIPPRLRSSSAYLTPPPRPPRPLSSQLPPRPTLAVRYPREPRRPPPLNLQRSNSKTQPYQLGIGPHPFAVSRSPFESTPRLLPAAEIISPRTYRFSKLVDREPPVIVKKGICVDLMSVLGDLVNDCGEAEHIRLDIRASESLKSESMIFDFPIPPPRNPARSPSSSFGTGTPTSGT